MKPTPIKVHWAYSKPNFGDWLSPALCQSLSGRHVEHARSNRCDLVAVGSILQRLSHRRWFNRPVHVWGSGFLEDGPVISSPHRYHAVRGWRTAQRLRGVEVRAVGDPGLLVTRLLPNFSSIEKTSPLGIVPHYKERELSAVQSLVAQVPGAVVLDTFLPTMEFLQSLAACEFVLSSSLHGLIVADAFGIPNAWIQLSDLLRGGVFKFHDYYSAFGIRTPHPLDVKSGLSAGRLKQAAFAYERPDIARIRRDLEASFPFPSAREEENVTFEERVFA